jgi:putative Ca2+/H+ antiporter (TMEM165/GDT1 family)
MMAANVPAVFLGHALIKRVPIRALQIGAAALFLMLGLWLLANIAQSDWFRAAYPVR